MKEYETLFEKYSHDVLTDNTQIPKYEQCKDCRYSTSGMRGTPDYRKGYCAIYPYDESRGKPNGIFNGSVVCKHKAPYGG